VCAFVGSHSKGKRKKNDRYNAATKDPKHVANYCKKKEFVYQ